MCGPSRDKKEVNGSTLEDAGFGHERPSKRKARDRAFFLGFDLRHLMLLEFVVAESCSSGLCSPRTPPNYRSSRSQVPKDRLSFGEELEEDDDDAAQQTFSITASTSARSAFAIRTVRASPAHLTVASPVLHGTPGVICASSATRSSLIGRQGHAPLCPDPQLLQISEGEDTGTC